MAAYSQEDFPLARTPEDLFECDYWDIEAAIGAQRPTAHFNLTTREIKLMAPIFESAVAKIMREGTVGAALTPGEKFDPDSLAPGTVVLVDLERVRKGVTPKFGDQIEYDLAYPGQVSHLINCSAEELIQLQATRRRSDRYRPAQVDFGAAVSPEWQYARMAWFGMVAPTKDGLDVISFAEAGDEPAKELFQMRKNLAQQIHRPAAVGQTTLAVVTDSEGKKVAEYQRLNALSVFDGSASELDRQVYKIHFSSRLLGRRAVRHLRSAGFVGDSK